MKIRQILLSTIFAVAVAVGHAAVQDEAGVDAIELFTDSLEYDMSPTLEDVTEEDHPFLRERQLNAAWCSTIMVQQQPAYPNKPTLYFSCPPNRNIKVCWKPKWKFKGICKNESVTFTSGSSGTCEYTFQYIPCGTEYKAKVSGGGSGTCSINFSAC